MFRLEVIATCQAGKLIYTRHDCVFLSSYWSSRRYYLTRAIATARDCQFANDQVSSAYGDYWMSTTVAVRACHCVWCCCRRGFRRMVLLAWYLENGLKTSFAYVSAEIILWRSSCPQAESGLEWTHLAWLGVWERGNSRATLPAYSVKVVLIRE